MGWKNSSSLFPCYLYLYTVYFPLYFIYMKCFNVFEGRQKAKIYGKKRKLISFHVMFCRIRSVIGEIWKTSFCLHICFSMLCLEKPEEKSIFSVMKFFRCTCVGAEKFRLVYPSVFRQFTQIHRKKVWNFLLFLCDSTPLLLLEKQRNKIIDQNTDKVNISIQDDSKYIFSVLLRNTFFRFSK